MLEEHFSEEETNRQLETALNWGRYAELFDRDASSRPLLHFRRRPRTTNDRPDGLSRSLIREQSWSVLVDLLVFALVLASIFGVLTIGRYWLGAATPGPIFPIRRARCRFMLSIRWCA